MVGPPLDALKAGNDRFRGFNGQRPQHPRQSVDCAKTLKCCQKPFAIVLSCADSRIPPEVIFDQGIGDLFVVRVAGNVTTPGVLGSIEYAVDHFTNMIIVLGHQRCGAVEAAFGARPGPHLNAIWDLIRPAIPAPPPRITDRIWETAVRQNVRNMVVNLEKDLQVKSKPIIKEAYFSLETGEAAIKP
jgi:carbonic anhydrase